MCNVIRVFSALVLGVFVCISWTGFAANPKKSDPDLRQREYMLKISRQLGVTCNHCHDVKNFKSAKMETYKISQQHMKLVDLLNTHGFGMKKPVRADCYLCHRGKPVPDYREPAKP